jgi:hypothetical protein
MGATGAAGDRVVAPVCAERDRLAVRRGAYLRAYAYDFIERFAQGFTRADIERALQVVAE